MENISLYFGNVLYMLYLLKIGMICKITNISILIFYKLVFINLVNALLMLRMLSFCCYFEDYFLQYLIGMTIFNPLTLSYPNSNKISNVIQSFLLLSSFFKIG
jgi:hypothetical protein